MLKTIQFTPTYSRNLYDFTGKDRKIRLLTIIKS